MARKHFPLLGWCMIVLAACGGAGAADAGTGPGTTTNPTGQASTNSITVGDNSFNPGAVNVTPGTTVTWKWAACSPDGGGYGYGSTTCPVHNVMFDDGSNLASGSQDTGTYSRTFTAAGTYKYHCAIHGAPMSGEVVVK